MCISEAGAIQSWNTRATDAHTAELRALLDEAEKALKGLTLSVDVDYITLDSRAILELINARATLARIAEYKAKP